MALHHDRCFKKYIDGLNALLCRLPGLQALTLPQLMAPRPFPSTETGRRLLNAAGAVFCHSLYFRSMAPGLPQAPGEELSQVLESCFGSLRHFQKQWIQSACSLPASGWVWLCADRAGLLHILCTADHFTVLPLGYRPLLVMDVWEHAYYLKYQNDRRRYAESWLRLACWETAEKAYRHSLKL